MKLRSLPTLEDIAKGVTSKSDDLAKSFTARYNPEKRAATTKQAPSTQAILDRDPALDEAAKAREISTVGQTTTQTLIEEVDKAVRPRNVTPKEVQVQEDFRRTGRGHTFEQPEDPAIDALKRSEVAKGTTS